ncbi:MAG TPA: DUF6352 family protein [Xanthobacteraceae bacterium]|nr:DUF6352 family protein [Xanthobacteraceae bacterium]
MNDFWLSCGHHLLDRDADGRLTLTDEFLKAYLARPELAPPPEACAVERALHRALLLDPRRRLSADEIAAIADADARENWQLMAALNEQLVAHRTIEAGYLTLVREGKPTAPLFLDQLVHVILRNVLDGADDPFLPRAAELFFRPQRLTVYEGSLIAADDERVAAAAASPLAAMLGLPLAADIDVLSEANAATYWQRSDRFDMALDLTAGRRGVAALGAVIARWIEHLLDVEVEIEPVIELREVSLSWYVGLDAEATRLGDLLWRDGALAEDDRARIIAIYRLGFCDPAVVFEHLAAEPVYLILAMTPQRTLRMKPQNLITGLPIRRLEAAQ